MQLMKKGLLIISKLIQGNLELIFTTGLIAGIYNLWDTSILYFIV